MKHPTSNIHPGNFGIGTCRAGVIKTPSSALDLDLGGWSFSGSWMLDVESFGSLREFWYGCHR